MAAAAMQLAGGLGQPNAQLSPRAPGGAPGYHCRPHTSRRLDTDDELWLPAYQPAVQLANVRVADGAVWLLFFAPQTFARSEPLEVPGDSIVSELDAVELRIDQMLLQFQFRPIASPVFSGSVLHGCLEVLRDEGGEVGELSCDGES